MAVQFLFQGKFQFVRKNGETGHTQHGYRVEASPLVVLNALGFIGFKVIAVAGTHQVAKILTNQPVR